MNRDIFIPNWDLTFTKIRRSTLAPTAVTSNPLIGHPRASWHLAILPKYIQWHPATRVPIAAYAQPTWGQQINKLFANANGTSLVERLVVAETI